jgi:protein tyrosine phosphatase
MVMDALEYREILRRYGELDIDNEIYTTEIASNNYKKNRYRDILPYDQNLIKKMTKYINASPISVNGEEQYIATQGPLSSTMEDFWEMILKYKSRVILMLCQLEENGRQKCYKYWPNVKESLNLKNNLSVKCVEEIYIEEAKCYKRSLELTSNVNNSCISTLLVTHIQYVAWPDHYVPDVKSFYSLYKIFDEEREEKKNNSKECYSPPLPVVHCSAGVGRTGTFCAIDIATNTGKSLDSIIKDMRKQRCHMVQTFDQFIFCHSYMKQFPPLLNIGR